MAVFAQELFELENLRPMLKAGTTTIEDFIAHTRPGNTRNLHDQAWDYADYGVQPAADQIEAAKKWLESKANELKLCV